MRTVTIFCVRENLLLYSAPKNTDNLGVMVWQVRKIEACEFICLLDQRGSAFTRKSFIVHFAGYSLFVIHILRPALSFVSL